jgi:photosystem II stability/assembly factor-like uncharacterized protein
VGYAGRRRTTTAAAAVKAAVEYAVSVTSDGGANWSWVDVGEFPSTTYASIAFADAERGYLLVTPTRSGDGQTEIYRTDDGGASWLPVGHGSDFGFVLGTGPGRDDVWAGANAEAGGPPHPALVASHDGGRTWSDVSLPGIGPASRPVVVDPPAFFSASDGLVAIDGARFYRTTDVGWTWTQAAALATEPGQVSWRPAVDPSTWFALDNPITTFERTDDAGRTWTTMNPTGFAPGMGPTWLAFWTGSDGAALGALADGDDRPAAIYVTSDGGATWAPEHPATTARVVNSATAGAPAIAAASWWVDPRDQPPSPNATHLRAFVLESACASGASPAGRVRSPVIEYRPDSIVVTFTIMSRPGEQDSQGNPPFPVEITLDEPIDNRTLLNGSAVPPRDANAQP